MDCAVPCAVFCAVQRSLQCAVYCAVQWNVQCNMQWSWCVVWMNVWFSCRSFPSTSYMSWCGYYGAECGSVVSWLWILATPTHCTAALTTAQQPQLTTLKDPLSTSCTAATPTNTSRSHHAVVDMSSLPWISGPSSHPPPTIAAIILSVSLESSHRPPTIAAIILSVSLE